MQVSYSEFKNGVKNKEIKPVYLFEGEDAFFRNRGVELIKDEFIVEPDLNFKSFDGENLDLGEVISSLESFPFLSPKRLTVIKEFYPDKTSLKSGFAKYIEKPISDSILVVVNTKPCETLKKFENVYTINCKKADSITIAKWVELEGKKVSVSVERNAALKIAEYCLNDMARVEMETQKVLSYALKDGVVTEQTIELLVSRDTDYKIYKMTDYIGQKKFSMALEVIKEMMAKGEPPQRLIVSIYNYYRRLLHVAISDQDNTTLAKLLEAQDFVIRNLKTQSKMFSKRAIKRAVDVLVDADYKSKCGAMDFNEAFWLSVFKIMVEG